MRNSARVVLPCCILCHLRYQYAAARVKNAAEVAKPWVLWYDAVNRSTGDGNMLNMHIFLVGMAGAGKTSLGRRLAANMNLPFVDTDQRVSEIMGMSVIEIFQTLGAAFFRNAEAGVLMELIGKPPCVVSTGGGLPTVQENVLLMQNHGVIIHVDRPLDQILSDIKMERRPTLAGGSYENVIDQYNERIGHYRACADYRLDNSHGFAVGLQTLTQMVEGLE